MILQTYAPKPTQFLTLFNKNDHNEEERGIFLASITTKTPVTLVQKV